MGEEKKKWSFWQRVFSRSPHLSGGLSDDAKEEARKKNLKGVHLYLEERLQKQRAWYERKATQNKKQFMRTQTTIIILSALIPLLVAFDGALSIVLDPLLETLFAVPAAEAPNWASVFSALISAVIAILASIDKLNQPQTNWFNYRANEELLKKEEWMFHFGVGPYSLNVPDPKEKLRLRTRLLVERVEGIISADIARFTQSERTIEMEVPNVVAKPAPTTSAKTTPSPQAYG